MERGCGKNWRHVRDVSTAASWSAGLSRSVHSQSGYSSSSLARTVGRALVYPRPRSAVPPGTDEGVRRGFLGLAAFTALAEE